MMMAAANNLVSSGDEVMGVVLTSPSFRFFLSLPPVATIGEVDLALVCPPPNTRRRWRPGVAAARRKHVVGDFQLMDGSSVVDKI